MELVKALSLNAKEMASEYTDILNKAEALNPPQSDEDFNVWKKTNKGKRYIGLITTASALKYISDTKSGYAKIINYCQNKGIQIPKGVNPFDATIALLSLLEQEKAKEANKAPKIIAEA